MKTKIIFYHLAILIFLIFFVTCSKESPTEPEKPQLSINLNSFIFTKNVTTQTLIITNNGGQELSWEITDKVDWLTVSKNSGKITTVGDTVIMTANVTQPKGTYQDTVKIISNGGNEDIDIMLNLETWITRASIPTPRNDFGTCVVGNKIYAIGGWNGTQSLASVEEYNPATDKWTQKTSMPTRRLAFATCAVNRKIYIIGGQTTLGAEGMSRVEEYDPTNDSWTTKKDMITPRANLSACQVNGKIYAIGGYTDWHYTLPTVEEYDPVSDSWTARTDMPITKWGHEICAVNNKIHVLMGATGSSGSAQWLNTVEEYDPSTDKWISKSNTLIRRVYFAASVVNDKIYIFGGSASPNSASSTVKSYDPYTDTWVDEPNMLTARWGLSASAINGQIFVIGGAQTTWESEPLSIVEAYDP